MTILREITNAKHREVENLPFIQYLLKGKISKKHYVTYLYELKTIYYNIESLAKKHGLLDGLYDIERYSKIVEDLQELDPTYSHETLNSTNEYIKYITHLSETNAKLLFAHVYVRHMGDLYGGKLIARMIPGSGKSYMFEDRSLLVKAFNAKLTEDLGDEANRAFDHFIKIFSEMETLIN